MVYDVETPTYTVDGNAFTVNSYGDLGALPLLDAAYAADTGGVWVSTVTFGNRVRQRRQSEDRLDLLEGRHVVLARSSRFSLTPCVRR